MSVFITTNSMDVIQIKSAYGFCVFSYNGALEHIIVESVAISAKSCNMTAPPARPLLPKKA